MTTSRIGSSLIICLMALVLVGSCAHRVAGEPRTARNVEASTERIPQLFVLIYRPGPAWREGIPLQSQALRPHGEYMQALLARGALFAAGRFWTSDGGMAVVRASSLDEARAIQAADPAVTSGIFVSTVEQWAPRFRSEQPLSAPQ